MRPEYNVREVAVSDGIQTVFTFDFKIVNPEHLLVLLYRPIDGALLWEARGNETTYFTTVLNDDLSGGSITTYDIPETDTQIIMLLADDAPTQPTKFTADTRYTMKKIEASLDILSGQVQRIRYLLDRSIRLPEKWTAELTTELAEVVPEAVPMVNEAGDAFILVPRSEFKGDSGVDGLTPNIYFSAEEPDPGLGDSGDLWIVSVGGAVYKNVAGIWLLQGYLSGVTPPDDEAYSVMESVEDLPDNPGTFKAAWSDPLSYVGFTQRFNQIIDLKGLKAVVDYIMNMGYVQPNLSLVGNIATGLREIGDVVSGVTLTANFTKTLDDLVELRIYLNPSTLLDTQAIGPGSGSGNNVYATPFSNTITFRAEIDDVSVQSKPSRTATLTFSFVYPYFWGSGASGLTAAQVATLTKDIRASQDNITRNFTVGGGNYFYFAQPASYPLITKIYDANNFEVQGGFTSFTGTYTALDGSTQTLRVYVNTAPVGVDTLLRYVR